MKFLTKLLACTSVIAFTSMSSSANAQTMELEIVSASGVGHASFPASNAIDGSTAFASRFASRENPDDLFLDLGDVRNVESLSVAWGRGNNRTYRFEIATRETENDNWNTVFSGDSSGTTTNLENYDIDDSNAQFIRVRGVSNSRGSAWTNFTEVQAFGTEVSTPDSTFGEQLHITSASGPSHASFPPSNVLDRDLNFSSRFASRDNPDDLFLNLGIVSRLNNFQIAWGRGDNRTHTFEIATRETENDGWNTVFSGTSSGTTTDFENYDVDDSNGQFIRIRGNSNSANSAWTNITEVQGFGTSLVQNGQIPSHTGTAGVTDTFLGFLVGEADYDGRGNEYDQVDYEGSPNDYNIVEADEAGTYLVFKPGGGNDVLVSIDGIFFEGSQEQFNIEDLADGNSNGGGNTGGGNGNATLTHFGEPITLIGANIPYSNDQGFSADFGWYNDLNLDAYRDRFNQIQAAGGNSARVWLHTTGQVTPEIQPNGTVSSLSRIRSNQAVINQLRDVLDEAWDRGIVVNFSLFSFDMFCDEYGDDFGYEQGPADIARHRVMIEENYNSYINNALLPMVNGLKDHPGLFAYEVFNEPEGAIRGATAAGHFCSDEPGVPGDGLSNGLSLPGAQRFVNRVAAAIHGADPNVKVTTSTHTDFFDQYSNSTLLSTPGADPNGTLDFYELHFYPSYQNPPYTTGAFNYNSDRPIVIGEYDLDQVASESFNTVNRRDSISEIINNGYAGAWPWALLQGNADDIQDAISDVPNAVRALDTQAVEACIQSQDPSCYNQ